MITGWESRDRVVRGAGGAAFRPVVRAPMRHGALTLRHPGHPVTHRARPADSGDSQLKQEQRRGEGGESAETDQRKHR